MSDRAVDNFRSNLRPLAKDLRRPEEHCPADNLGAPLHHSLRRCLVAAQSCLHNLLSFWGTCLACLHQPCRDRRRPWPLNRRGAGTILSATAAAGLSGLSAASVWLFPTVRAADLRRRTAASTRLLRR